MTRCPSVTGEGVHGGLSLAVSSFSVHVTPDCQSGLPLCRSKHSTMRRFPVACVTKRRLPHTTGVELPRSGNGTCQEMFSFVLQRRGRCISAVTPSPSDPRQAG